ncbi:calcium release-activated calcium channel protein 1 isoform X2 [Folsomia candida]|uniref:calcium release-activated calcium channel protein 1 isoform X2 n=1 Tax=Folsomia candida TaxID=158441 RepID=UPI000B8F8C0D|nr:calcium release-activated calcium channel protein 1 isoform X2 [Folsomia candida]
MILSTSKVIKWDTVDLDPASTPKLTDPIWDSEVIDSWKRLHWCQSHLNTVVHITNIMSFFAITAAVELQIQPDLASEPLIIAYVVTTCLLVGTTIIVKIGSSTILPHIEAVSGMGSNSSEVFTSPHDQLFDHICIICFLGQTFAPFLFCMDLILIAWIKFAHFAIEAPMAVTAIIVPVQVVISLFGYIMIRRIQRFREEHRIYLNRGPTRRYSEIAETWNENEDELEVGHHSEDSSLLASYRTNTSYGAVLGSDDVFNQCKVLVDMH